MPGKNKSYILTMTAERDFRQAKQWSLSRWGKELTNQYFKDLHDGAQRIAKESGSLAESEALTGTTSLGIYAIREHYIVYVPVSKNQIVIVSLIRQTRDVPTILKTNGYVFRRELKEILDKL